jgi:prepilin-type N-terminal cleavage/methylation domain-containing protein
MLRSHDEAGYTLVELLVAMTVMLLVSGALVGALQSATVTERRASGRIDDEQSVRLGLAQFERDVRSSQLLTADPSTLGHDLDLQLGADHIRWSYDAGASTLSRSIVTDSSVTTGAVVPGVSAGADPMFALVGRDGRDLGALAGATSLDQVRCAASVKATVTSVAQRGMAPFTEIAVAPLPPPRDLEGCP